MYQINDVFVSKKKFHPKNEPQLYDILTMIDFVPFFSGNHLPKLKTSLYGPEIFRLISISNDQWNRNIFLCITKFFILDFNIFIHYGKIYIYIQYPLEILNLTRIISFN